jgi:predicted peptidase
LKKYAWITILFTLIIIFSCSRSFKLLEGIQTPQNFMKEIKQVYQGKYLLYLPENYKSSEKKWPLLLFLHGAGERGNDLEILKKHGPPKLIAQRDSFPFVIVSPQCQKNKRWETKYLAALLDDIIQKYEIDENRIYLTGLSMGGFGTWALAMEYPEKFAAIAPVCGGGDVRQVDKIQNLPAWVFHGAKDKVVPPERSKEMVKALKKIGGIVKFTLYPEAGHDSWTQTYENPELYKWFLQYRKVGL